MRFKETGHPRWPRHCYSTLAQRWLHNPGIFGPFGPNHDPDAVLFDVLNAYRGVANANDLLCRPKTDQGEEWDIGDNGLSVWDPYTDRIWQVTGYDLNTFEVNALNLHGKHMNETECLDA